MAIDTFVVYVGVYGSQDDADIDDERVDGHVILLETATERPVS